MPVELNGLRMAIEEWDAVGGVTKDQKRAEVMDLVTPGVVKILLAALDDPDRLNDDPED